MRKSIKKCMCFLITFILVWTSIPMLWGYQNVEASEVVPEGYTPIYTIEDLVGINNNPSGKYILMNDIDMTEETAEGGSWDTGHGWTPLDEFHGIFDGNGKRIIGMHIYGNAGSYVGLFSSTSGSSTEIRNLAMVDVNISLSGGGTYVGAIVGCYYTFYKNTSNKIRSCYATGKIDTSRTNDCYIGGLAGYINGSYVISDCYNQIEITSSYDSSGVYIGGILGCKAYEGSIVHCYNTAKLSGLENQQCGSIIGKSHYGSDMSECYSLFGAPTSYEGTILTDAQMHIKNSFKGFDFDSTWFIDPNSTHPYPQLMNNLQRRITKIVLSSVPNETNYYQGDSLNLRGGVVTISYEDGYDTDLLLEDTMISGYEKMNVGTQTVLVTYGRLSISYQVTVNAIPVTQITIPSGSAVSVQKGYSVKLPVSILPSNASDQALTWTSSDSQIATVDNTGAVKGLKVGEVEITTTAHNGVYATHMLHVTSPSTVLKLDQSEVTMNKNDTCQLTAFMSPVDTSDQITWTSSDAEVVSVSSDGLLSGCNAGKASIIALADSGIKAKCDVTVFQSITDYYILGVTDKSSTGKEITQDIAVTDGQKTLTKGQDYVVSYSNNINPGTAKIIVTGIGYFNDKLEKEYTIKQGISTNDTSTKSDTSTNASAQTTNKTNTSQISISSITGNQTKFIDTVRIIKLKNSATKKLTIKYSQASKAEGYQIRYSTKSSMKGAKKRFVSSNIYSIKGLKKKKYYIQVRAYIVDEDGDKVYSAWSSKKSVQVKK